MLNLFTFDRHQGIDARLSTLARFASEHDSLIEQQNLISIHLQLPRQVTPINFIQVKSDAD